RGYRGAGARRWWPRIRRLGWWSWVGPSSGSDDRRWSPVTFDGTPHPRPCPSVQQHVGVEAGVGAGVAGRAGLVDGQQHRVAVAVELDPVHLLGVAGLLALDPHPPARAGEIAALAGGQRAGERRIVHPGHHQHRPGRPVLGDRADQAVGVAFEPGRDVRVEGVHIGLGAHRTSIPSAAMASLTSAMVISPKWNPLAASTASAPAVTAGAKCSGAPAPPEAMIGTVTAARTAAISSRSKPALVPSPSIELSRISPAPSSAPRRAHSTASTPALRLPPWVVTSQPESVCAAPAGTRRASTESTTHWRPNRS